jgi:hypothetical protein
MDCPLRLKTSHFTSHQPSGKVAHFLSYTHYSTSGSYFLKENGFKSLTILFFLLNLIFD